ncbi:acyltransferase family protein [Bosea sp. MMO-172]|uniref:acyltransferase family protein n=1 Tax=Bosea sp. MMO-172 TaxID=3127885 RepID=UPI0030199C62
MKPGHFDFIDAVRGYAILGVIVVHVASWAPPTNGIALRLFEQGARGVQLFYVASAFTLLMSWRARNDGYLPFLVRRVFRITPLIWLAIPVYLLFSGLGSGYVAPPADWTKSDVFRQMFYVDSFAPNSYSIVPGGWTVNTEMLFYLILPIFVVLIKTWRAAIVAYFISLIFAAKFAPRFEIFLISRFENIPPEMLAVWGALSLPVQLPIFMSGFVVFYLMKEQILDKKEHRRILKLILVLSFCLMITFSFFRPITYGFWGVPLGILIFCFGRGVGGILINSAIVSLGKISFSAYIWHWLVLNFVSLDRDFGINIFGLGFEPSYVRFSILLVVVLSATSGVAFLSYQFIERPMIKIGGILAERVAKKHRHNKQAGHPDHPATGHS